jgi:hypothetical protein
MGTRLIRLLIVAIAISGWGLVGCSSKRPDTGGSDDVKQNLKQIFQAYQLAERDLRRPPKSAQELKPFLVKIKGSEEALESPNDQEPFVIIWGASTGPKAMMAAKKTEVNAAEPEYPPILAYEKQGTSKGRHVLFVMGPITVLDEERFRKATFANNHKP